MATAPSVLTGSYDDMDDSFEISSCREEVEAGNVQFLPLLNALKITEDLILPEFRAADSRATTYRSRYQHISELAVCSGLLAVVLGLVENVFPKLYPHMIVWVEFGAALVCLGAIFWGLHKAPKERWLLARYQAENLRLLKFRTLTDARLWSDDAGQADRRGKTPFENLCEDVRFKVETLQKLVYKQIEHCEPQGVVPSVSEIHCPDSCHDALQEIIQYYCDKRLTTQMKYLAAKSGEEKNGGVSTRWLTRIFFFVGFVSILIHSALSLKWEKALHSRPMLAQGLVSLAVLLPALVAGVRTYRASREFERNALRHSATLYSLKELNEEMNQARDLPRKFRVARSCELILEFDSFEFMRLLREVEWYG
jgi:hypothetical protein